MSAHAGGMCMSQCKHWRIPLFPFYGPRKEKEMQANPSVSTKKSLLEPLPKSKVSGEDFFHCFP